MALIAISVLLLMWNYIVSYKKEKKSRDEVEPLAHPNPFASSFHTDTTKKFTPTMETKLPPPAQQKTYYI